MAEPMEENIPLSADRRFSKIQGPMAQQRRARRVPPCISLRPVKL
ncbi:hypothetical protein SJA_C1-29440 [Sphingobium indicum UT26S]|uniref:Uncharacterized protein n=1 Tax=Sphingobium indicum (strain DSM 16413 / CCM 7287 / MTCC 6362 / UT26 / NBRC 101211 / UT26S) TaxID=452662 RepID=D4Z596_SPHIU|nr:hypothetical protein SJA_C1-29440 [Sphingobium indicum UT26S]